MCVGGDWGALLLTTIVSIDSRRLCFVASHFSLVVRQMAKFVTGLILFVQSLSFVGCLQCIEGDIGIEFREVSIEEKGKRG